MKGVVSLRCRGRGPVHMRLLLQAKLERLGVLSASGHERAVFLVFALEVRAERRHKDMLKTSPEISLESVQENLASRDQIDTTRATSPLKPASDAIAFDTGVLTRSAQLEKAINHVNEVLAQ